MDRIERAALWGSGLLMAAFFVLLVYAASSRDLDVPTCVTDVPPFTQGKVIDKGNNRYEVHMVAKMWAFDPPEVRLPPGAEVDLYLSALDVTHGAYIEHTNVNLMAVPGAVNGARLRFDAEGDYRVICHEYCGTGHHYMMGKFVVTSAPAEVPAEEPGTVSLGRELFDAKGCLACHSIDGSPSVGPTVQAIAGRTVTLEDGTTTVADAAYLERALRDPNAEIVKGFPPVMPEQPLTDEEVGALVAYMQALE